MLEIENISKSFNGKKIVNNVSLTIPTGTIAVLLGPSGVGKSTILRILNNLEKPETGTIKLNGKKIDLQSVNKTHTISMVFQHFNLFDNLTVEENITLPLTLTTNLSQKAAQKIADDLLAQYDLTDKKKHRIAQLSGGQKQRLAIARTIALKPKVVCMDEPTSALDPTLTSHIATTITNLATQGFTVILTTHNPMLFDKLDCTIHLMKSGSIIESAPSKSFKENPDPYPHIKKFISGKS